MQKKIVISICIIPRKQPITKMLFRDKITKIFYDFDEYLKNYHPVVDQEFSLTNQAQMSLSKMASIIIGYHQSKYKCFKFYY